LYTAAELLALDLPEPQCIVQDIITAGASLLAGRPKMGKSWLAKKIAIDVALGRPTLGDVPVVAGDALYLALEDNNRRLKRHITKLLDGAAPPERLTLATWWPRLDEGGMELVNDWVEAASEPKLVVIDTLARMRRPSMSRQANQYLEDYEAMAAIKKMADEHDLAVVVIHHVRKQPGFEDVFDEISGTTGLTGAADTMLVLRRERGQADALLHLSGRDLEEKELVLSWDNDNCHWSVLGPAADFPASEMDRAAKVLAEQKRPMTPTQLAPLLGKAPAACKMLLWRASKEGKVKTAGKGAYQACASPAESPANPAKGGRR
jgi:hypothetical protein